MILSSCGLKIFNDVNFNLTSIFPFKFYDLVSASLKNLNGSVRVFTDKIILYRIIKGVKLLSYIDYTVTGNTTSNSTISNYCIAAGTVMQFTVISKNSN